MIMRIYQPFSGEDNILLSERNRHHVANVMRCREGDICHIFDGKGQEVKVSIISITKKEVIVNILERLENSTESLLNIHLFQALCKGDKMDFIVQKSVELGVKAITPLLTERCDVKLFGDRLEKRMMHWQNIITHAAEQSGRAVLPILNEPLALQAAVLQQAHNLRLLFTPHTDKSLSAISAPANQDITIFIGPEGGFSESETTWAKEQGVAAVILGKRILRTETASIAIMSSLQMLWGDFR